MSSPLPSNSCYMLIPRTRAMVVEKQILSTLLHIIIIWCLSVQESVQLDYNTFQRGIPGIDLSHSASKPRPLQLYSRASMKHIRIKGREIDAEGENGDILARLIIRTDSLDGQITIQGEETEYYLCINKRGQVVGRKRIKRSSGVMCVFTETISNDYTELMVEQKGMYLGFNRDGQAVNAERTKLGARQFLKRPLPEDTPPDEEGSLSTVDLDKFYHLIQQAMPRGGAAPEETDS